MRVPAARQVERSAQAVGEATVGFKPKRRDSLTKPASKLASPFARRRQGEMQRILEVEAALIAVKRLGRRQRHDPR